MTEDREKWRKYVHGQPSDRGRLKNRTEPTSTLHDAPISLRRGGSHAELYLLYCVGCAAALLR